MFLAFVARRTARRTAQAPLQSGHLADGLDAAARRAPAQHAHHLRSSLRFLPLLSLLLAVWACTIGSHIGARTLPITHRPASELRLVIQITGQYSDRPYVVVLVHIFEGTNPNEVALAGRAHMTCNGSDISPSSPAFQLVEGSCPRQPPGGSYRFTYTDEHGASATVVVPIPLGSFAILSPLAGSTVPIPTNGPLTVRYVTPIPPTSGSVAIDSVTASCRTSLDVCGTVYASLQHNDTPTPSVGAGSSITTTLEDRGLPPAAASAFAELATPTPAPGATPTPEATLTPGGGAESSTATVTQSGNMGTITLKGDYSRFNPGPGEVDLSVEAQVVPHRGGFAAATVTFVEDTISAPITWAR
jgi:hypothetical protein